MWASRTEGRTVTWTQMLSVDIWGGAHGPGVWAAARALAALHCPPAVRRPRSRAPPSERACVRAHIMCVLCAHVCVHVCMCVPCVVCCVHVCACVWHVCTGAHVCVHVGMCACVYVMHMCACVLCTRGHVCMHVCSLWLP